MRPLSWPHEALFPLSYLATTASLTVVIIGVGLIASPAAAADLALSQGALIATFIAFSANLRNLLLQRAHAVHADDLLAARMLILPVLCIAAYFLSVEIAQVPVALAVVVIARRACEWVAEVRLNLLELEGDRKAAISNVAVQVVATALVIAAYALFPRLQLVAMVIWAASPLVIAPKIRVGVASFQGHRLVATFKALLPHAGSSVVAGLSMYVLRVIIVVAAERELGGLILTGVAIGSIAGTLFANVVGPTIAMRSADYNRSPAYRLALVVLVVAGAGFCALSLLAPAVLGLHSTFWLATGLSLAGSAVMITAQRARLTMFQERNGDELFAADVLRCLTLLVLILAVAYLSRPAALAAAYLLDAALAWLFYLGARRRWLDAFSRRREAETWVCALVALLIVFPLFFQLRGTVYQHYEPMLESGGSISNVPLPVSMLACFGGIVLLGGYRHASLAMSTVFVFFVCLVLTTIIASGRAAGYDAQKLVLMIQFMVPTFALVLGQIVASRPGGALAAVRVMAYTVALIAAMQLALTVIFSEDYLLTHDFFIFSVYQHRQFVPVVFVGIFLAGLYALWRTSPRRWLLVLAASFMAVYTVHSFSTAALVLLGAGMIGMVVVFRGRERTGLLALLILAVATAAIFNLRASKHFREKYELGFENRPPVHAKALVGADTKLPENVARRLDDWVLYGTGIVESPRLAVFGHPLPFDRAIATSAHNFYLDLFYNFGLVAFLPLLALIAYTAVLIVRHRSAVLSDPALAGMALVWLFVIVVDNNLKVTLRQPYPGIFSYFLWGLLLSRLLQLQAAPKGDR